MAHTLTSNKLILTVDNTPYQICNVDSITFTNPVVRMQKRGVDGTGKPIIFKTGLAESQSLEVSTMDITDVRMVLKLLFDNKYKSTILEWVDENTGNSYRAKDVVLEAEPLQNVINEDPSGSFTLKFTFFDVEFVQV